jgi:hypothetical protein
MASHARRLLILGFVLAAATTFVSASSATSSGGATSIQPTLYVEYTMDCTFAILDDAGRNVSSIAPGNYQVDVRTPIPFGTIPRLGVNDMTACRGMPQFQLTGPGVSFSTTLTAGCEADFVFTQTFQPGATYIAQDNNQPSVAHATFTTLTSGSPGSASASYGSTSSGKGTASTDIVGSALLASRGTLTGNLSANGKPTLTSKGKAVSTLKAGRYAFAITDQDAKGSFSILGPKTRAATHLTGVKFVGKRSITVTLTAGRWMYYAGLGQIRYFSVTH